ncbi:hypothetical protein AVEN_47433-1 [Araneus ventricosus]|uniref:Uncharacterized protein n=1 Tax=Araneus ventricosus TaxID=182803 RepID=A0A4Y2U863_ARAVE|nr:hypothetical protein AVEN_47433-1 [Araneus ventricosus]
MARRSITRNLSGCSRAITHKELVGWHRTIYYKALVRMAERFTHKALVRMAERSTHKRSSGWSSGLRCAVACLMEPRSRFLQRFPCDVRSCQEHYKYSAVGFEDERLWSANAFEESLMEIRLLCELESW